ncbi:hypothetical protein EK21DRAFT_111037 [Setomelanomma holmii]|uniref:Uncharacterized protein n=1 Tax=Setomelanomma holmii TaxID=210430 RepID=A0A9P4HBZ3_9PLEO|nr:hypothetical protein EK21DRAFT_111037 [Setomelanomma holmii]
MPSTMFSTQSETPLTINQSKVYGKVQRALLQTSQHWNDLWYAGTPLPLSYAQVQNPWLWNAAPHRIDKTLLYPAFDAATMTVAPRIVNATAYEKKLDLLALGTQLFEQPSRSDVIAREIKHANTCDYIRMRMYVNTTVSLSNKV